MDGVHLPNYTLVSGMLEFFRSPFGHWCSFHKGKVLGQVLVECTVKQLSSCSAIRSKSSFSSGNISGKQLAPGGKKYTWKYYILMSWNCWKKAVISCDGSLQEQRTIIHGFISLFPARMSMVLVLDISNQCVACYFPTANYQSILCNLTV